MRIAPAPPDYPSTYRALIAAKLRVGGIPKGQGKGRETCDKSRHLQARNRREYPETGGIGKSGKIAAATWRAAPEYE